MLHCKPLVLDHGTAFGNRVSAGGMKDLEMRSSWMRVALKAMGVSSQKTEEETQPPLVPKRINLSCFKPPGLSLVTAADS
jgi:hypothetical protein